MLGFIRSVPQVWDETRVLEGSKIGEFVAFARRSGENWYVGIMNCSNKKAEYELDLSFLGDGDYRASLYYDLEGSRRANRVETGKTVKRNNKIPILMQPGGGFVGIFSKPREYTK